MTEIRLSDLDRDGAIAEALTDLHGDARAGFLRKAAIGSGALLAAFSTPAAALARSSSKAQDTSILNFALLLERLQSHFYTETERNKVLKGGLKRQATTVGAHERAHVEALTAALGAKAARAPKFEFGGATESADAFRRTAVAFEDLAVAAYKGQAPRLHSKEFLAAALAIHAVEARHAAWIRRLAGKSPVAGAFDEPKTRAQTTAIVARTQFVMSTTSTKKRPRFTG
jgi:hypothetical protein